LDDFFFEPVTFLATLRAVDATFLAADFTALPTVVLFFFEPPFFFEEELFPPLFFAIIGPFM
jgi:hypothetical protein